MPLPAPAPATATCHLPPVTCHPSPATCTSRRQLLPMRHTLGGGMRDVDGMVRPWNDRPDLSVAPAPWRGRSCPGSTVAWRILCSKLSRNWSKQCVSCKYVSRGTPIRVFSCCLTDDARHQCRAVHATWTQPQGLLFLSRAARLRLALDRSVWKYLVLGFCGTCVNPGYLHGRKQDLYRSGHVHRRPASTVLNPTPTV